MIRIADSRIPLMILVLALALQALWKFYEPPPKAYARDLPSPPDAGWVKACDMGEHAFASQLLSLELFSHDEQPGVSLPYVALDYERVREWMAAALALDPHNSNIMLAAAQVYSEVPDPQRLRIMLDFVHKQFLLDPGSRWPYLAHAALLARHRLQDMNLALRYANDLTAVKSAPAWARQMSLLLLTDMGEKQQAEIVLGGLIDSGMLKDEKEIAFLLNRINSGEE
ncbi:MAG: hypothetical protein WBX11_01160 [Thiobacillaceae bacterium]|jgi:hypothetical protein